MLESSNLEVINTFSYNI